MTIEYQEIEGGGVTSAQGFTAAGIHAGFRDDPDRLDAALLEADELCPAAGVFTQNVFCAAPVQISRNHLGSDSSGLARAMIINSGIANAATGERGLKAAEQEATLVADTVGCDSDDVLVASTGVIGEYLDLKPFETGIPKLHAAQSLAGGHDAARAIMTTDTHPKEYAITYVSSCAPFVGKAFTIGGMVKGSGMIMPNMATMIAVLTTDAPVPSRALGQALRQAADCSFNRVTVDSDTSTNDTCVLFASGKGAGSTGFAANAAITPDVDAFEEFCEALNQVCQTLARMIASDGEGSSKLITVQVKGAASDADADLAARSVANSPLVKTAVAGHDANWGRIAAALGKSGASFEQRAVDIDIMGIPVCRGGLAVGFDEDEALKRFENPEIVLACDLHAGDAQTTVWTCDLTHDYISINADYRS
ncbi:MAG: bifunctional glutamate N-acetyltransferase/amino-acid acetyltransferase ArgJ [Eggerthellaceae bacterium]